jgi:hypothetical protein
MRRAAASRCEADVCACCFFKSSPAPPAGAAADVAADAACVLHHMCMHAGFSWRKRMSMLCLHPCRPHAAWVAAAGGDSIGPLGRPRLQQRPRHAPQTPLQGGEAPPSISGGDATAIGAWPPAILTAKQAVDAALPRPPQQQSGDRTTASGRGGGPPAWLTGGGAQPRAGRARRKTPEAHR